MQYEQGEEVQYELGEEEKYEGEREREGYEGRIEESRISITGHNCEMIVNQISVLSPNTDHSTGDTSWFCPI